MAARGGDNEDRTYKHEFMGMGVSTSVYLLEDFQVISNKNDYLSIAARGVINSRVFESHDKKIREQATFVNVRAKGFVAERIDDLRIGKGSRLLVNGRLGADNYEVTNKETGDTENRYGLQLIVDEVGVSVVDPALQDSNYESARYGEDGSSRRSSRRSRDDEDEAPSRKRSSRRSRSKAQEPEEDTSSPWDDGEDDGEDLDLEPTRKRSSRRRSRAKVDDDVDDYLDDDDVI